MARAIDVNLISQLAAGAEHQEISKGGYARSTDPNFPVFSTPINRNVLIYFPMTNVVKTENGTEMKLLHSHVHTYKDGQFIKQSRCISGLKGGVFSEALGYDGTCPFCEAVKDCWKLYNLKLDSKAKELGIDPQNDTADALRSIRRNLVDEMAVKGAEEYVTFPVVVIPVEEGTTNLVPDWINQISVQYVTWTYKRYEKCILGGLSAVFGNQGHPGGMFWLWKFTYNTGGKQANARDSAKNATYAPIQAPQFLEQMKQYIPTLEKAAAGFTNEKAVEVLVCNQFMYKDDIDSLVNGVMSGTRNQIYQAESINLNAPAAPQSAGFGVNPLAGFGANQPATLGLETTAPATPANGGISIEL
jgi:glutaredoxin